MTVPLRPIVSSLWRRKSGPLLIAVQVALTLAILCNALFIVQQRVQRAGAPSGAEEPDLFFVSIVTPGYGEQPFDAQRRDEAILRAVPGVRSVAWTNQVPLNQSGQNTGVGRRPDDTSPLNAAVYAGGTELIGTLGLKIVEGRNFSADEVLDIDRRVSQQVPSQVIVSQALGARLFPDASGYVGRRFFLGSMPGDPEVTIVGVVERLVTPWGTVSWRPDDPEGVYSFIRPARSEEIGAYLVRAEPGQGEPVRAAALARLKQALPGAIVMVHRSMDEVRTRRYRNDNWLAGLLSVAIGLLLTMTAAGIVGLASLWVTQRRKQIGVRRALGARRGDIVRHFVAENLMITSLGVAAGLTLAVLLNQLLARLTGLQALPPALLAGGGLLMLLLGALAVLGPALRAARITPAEATRSV